MNRIGELAYRRGLSDGALAGRAGVSRAHLNRIKNGRAIPRLRVALRIARGLGCPASEVFALPRAGWSRAESDGDGVPGGGS